MYQIIASPTFKICLKRLVNFLERKYSLEKTQFVKKQIKKALVDNLVKNPYIAPVSDRLIELGIKEYRQLTIDEHNIVFYRVDKKCQQICLLAIMDSRQSIQKLLSELLLRL